MKLKFINLGLQIVLLFSLTVSAQEKIAHLGQYNIDKKQISISGISSGAFMATQMGVAYSDLFSGVASIAGGIYWCSQGETQRAQSECMNTTQNIDPKVQITYARKLAAENKIDSLDHLKNQKLFIFASPKDNIIKPPSSDKLLEFAQAFYDEKNISYEKTKEFGHGFPTLNFGALCNIGYLPWLLKCDYDGAGEVLSHAYENLKPRQENYIQQNIFTYDQSEFTSDLAQASLYKSGWVYVPTACQQGAECKLHVALHGCQMNPDYIQDQFVKNAGFNEWAESNNIIVLYPQAAKLGQANPYACWDWFGFTGKNYVERDGVQMKALRQMIGRLTGN